MCASDTFFSKISVPASVINKHETINAKTYRIICCQVIGFITSSPKNGSNGLQNLINKYQKSAAEIFYRFLNHIEIVPLNGTTSKKHMMEGLKIGEFELLDREIEEITQLLH